MTRVKIRNAQDSYSSRSYDSCPFAFIFYIFRHLLGVFIFFSSFLHSSIPGGRQRKWKVERVLAIQSQFPIKRASTSNIPLVWIHELVSNRQALIYL